MTCLTSHARLSASDPATLISRVRARLDGLEMAVEERAAGFACRNALGCVRLLREADAVALALEAPSRADLHMLRESVRYQIGQVDGSLAEALEWDGAGEWTGWPPNFRLLTLARSKRISPSFRRLRLRGEALEDFNRQGMHMRLLFPPPGREPVWPTLGRGGRTLWPEGADALHMPAYTIRRIEPAAGWLDVDVYLHGNGPTCAWAESAAPGARVGMMGPGGGWLPEAREILLAGDETALPAIARMLEAAPPEACGTAVVEVADQGDVQDLDHPAGVRLDWLVRGRDTPLLEAAQAIVPSAQAHVWFAAEKAQAGEMRNHLRETLGRPKRGDHVAAYWVAGT